jgi:hypothetical protein
MNKATLRERIRDLLNRTDLTDSVANHFIDQAMQRIQRALRTPMNEKLGTLIIEQEYPEFGLPVDFLELISLTYFNAEGEVAAVLERLPTTRLEDKKRQQDVTGVPLFFARKHLDILLYPVPSSGTLEVYYYSEFPEIDEVNPEHVLTKVAPDLVIYGALSFAADYFIDDRGPLFEQRYQTALAEIQEQSDAQQLSGGIQTVQPAYEY